MGKFFDDFEDLIKRMEIKFMKSKKKGISVEDENFEICPYCKERIEKQCDTVYIICYVFDHFKVTKQDLNRWKESEPLEAKSD